MKSRYYERIQVDQAIPEKTEFRSEKDYLQCLTDIVTECLTLGSTEWVELPLLQGEVKGSNSNVILNQHIYHTPEDILVDLRYSRIPNPNGEGLRVDWSAIELFSNVTSVDDLAKRLKRIMLLYEQRY